MIPRLVAILGLVFLAAPIYLAALASVTPEARLFEGPVLLPSAPSLEHYRDLFTERAFWQPIRNSLIVASVTTGFCVTFGAFCAYAIARLRFRGKRLVLGTILAVTMFPQISIVSPLYLLLRQLGLINTYPGLVLPYLTFAMPLTVWLLVGYFRQLPTELEDSDTPIEYSINLIGGSKIREGITIQVYKLPTSSVRLTGRRKSR